MAPKHKVTSKRRKNVKQTRRQKNKLGKPSDATKSRVKLHINYQHMGFIITVLSAAFALYTFFSDENDLKLIALEEKMLDNQKLIEKVGENIFIYLQSNGDATPSLDLCDATENTENNQVIEISYDISVIDSNLGLFKFVPNGFPKNPKGIHLPRGSSTVKFCINYKNLKDRISYKYRHQLKTIPVQQGTTFVIDAPKMTYPNRIVIPEGSEYDNEKISWMPKVNGSGYYDYFFMTNPTNEILYVDNVTGKGKLELPNLAFVAKVYQFYALP